MTAGQPDFPREQTQCNPDKAQAESAPKSVDETPAEITQIKSEADPGKAETLDYDDLRAYLERNQ